MVHAVLPAQGLASIAGACFLMRRLEYSESFCYTVQAIRSDLVSTVGKVYLVNVWPSHSTMGFYSPFFYDVRFIQYNCSGR